MALVKQWHRCGCGGGGGKQRIAIQISSIELRFSSPKYVGSLVECRLST
jgi:hypothetical protein